MLRQVLVTQESGDRAKLESRAPWNETEYMQRKLEEAAKKMFSGEDEGNESHLYA